MNGFPAIMLISDRGGIGYMIEAPRGQKNHEARRRGGGGEGESRVLAGEGGKAGGYRGGGEKGGGKKGGTKTKKKRKKKKEKKKSKRGAARRDGQVISVGNIQKRPDGSTRGLRFRPHVWSYASSLTLVLVGWLALGRGGGDLPRHSSLNSLTGIFRAGQPRAGNGGFFADFGKVKERRAGRMDLRPRMDSDFGNWKPYWSRPSIGRVYMLAERAGGKPLNTVLRSLRALRSARKAPSDQG